MNLKPGYKLTEVGVIPEEWDPVQLGDYVRITSGESPSLFKFLGTGVPYFKVEQLSNTEKYLTSTVTPYHFQKNKVVAQGSVVFAKRGAAIALNKVRILSQDSFMDTNLMALTPNEHLEAEFLFYYLGYIDLWRFADTTSVPQINNKHIKPLLFPLPRKSEQIAIAEALSDMDALLAALDQLIAKKRDLKQATMQQLLTGATRLPGFRGEWEVRRLGEIVEIKKGQLITNDTRVSGDIPVIAGGKQPAYYHNTANRHGRTITISGSGANAGYVALYNTPIFASDCSTISEGSDYSLNFIYYQLMLKQQDIYKTQTGGAQPHIHPSDVAPIEIAIPPLPEQTAIAEILSEMDAEILALEERRKKTAGIKQGMMQELLTGRVRLV